MFRAKRSRSGTIPLLYAGNTHDLIRSLKNKAKPAQKGCNNDLQLHYSQITTYASPCKCKRGQCDRRSQWTRGYRSPWTEGEGVECLLNGILVALEPSVRSVDFNILAPHVDVAVDRVAGYAENGSLNKVLAHHRQTAFRNQARKAKRGGRVDTERLVDASVEIRQTFDLISSSDQLIFRSKLLVEFLLKFLLDVWTAGEVIYDGAS